MGFFVRSFYEGMKRDVQEDQDGNPLRYVSMGCNRSGERGLRTSNGQVCLSIFDNWFLENFWEFRSEVPGSQGYSCINELVEDERVTYVVGGDTEYLSTILRCCGGVGGNGRSTEGQN